MSAAVYLLAAKAEEKAEVGGIGGRSHGFFIAEEEEEVGVLSESSSIGAASSESSSIGENSSSEAGEKEKEDEEVEVESEAKGLGSLDSMEDSLPIKRGLSNFYSGKSKSFTSLAEAASTAGAKELSKPENPFNKRRRVLAAWSRRASCSALNSAYPLPPLLAPDHTVAEGAEDEEESEEEDQPQQQEHPTHNKKHGTAFPPPRLSVHTQRGMVMRNHSTAFRSPRSFSLSDLQNTGYN